MDSTHALATIDNTLHLVALTVHNFSIFNIQTWGVGMKLLRSCSL